MKKIKYLWKLHQNKGPSSGQVRGYRLRLAHANMEGQAFGEPCPSFAKRFLISESGDYRTEQAAESHLERFLKDTPRFLNVDPKEVAHVSEY